MQHNPENRIKLKNAPLSWQGLGILHVHVEHGDTVDKIALDVAPPRTPVNLVRTVWYVWSM